MTDGIRTELLGEAMVAAYQFINQTQNTHTCINPGEAGYWEWKRQQVMSDLTRVMQAMGIDWQQQDPEDR